jgi:hypothetical protein
MFSKSWILVLGLALAPAIAIAQEQFKKGEQSNINTYPDCTVVAGNLIMNCGFETGNFNGWIWGGDMGASGVQSFCPHSGTYCAYMGPTGYNGTLTQCFAAPGPTCSLSFWVANSGQPSKFSVEWNSNPVQTLYYVPNIPYQQFAVSLPSSGFGCLTFTFYNPPAYISLDDVVVTCP